MAEEVTDDSRTSAVGRKRDRQEASQDREPLTLDDSSDDESHGTSPKRVKQGHRLADVRKMENVLVTLPVDESGHCRTLEAHQREEVVLHTSNGRPDPTVTADEKREIDTGSQSDSHHNSQGPNSSEEMSYGLVEAAITPEAEKCLASASTIEAIELPQTSDDKGSMPAHVVERAIASSAFLADTQGIPVSGWNKGVQSGLRTSFGTRPLLALANTRVEDLAASTSPIVPLSGYGDPQRDKGTKQDDGDTFSASPSTDDQELSMFTFGGGSSSQAYGSFPQGSFKRLSKAARKRLQPDEKEAYDKAMAANKQERREEGFEHKTAQADLAIAQERKWPLPKQYGDVLRWIRSGETFYARVDRKYKPFKAHSLAFDTPCGFDTKGIPVKAQDYSFNIFAPAFLKCNSRKLRDLRDEDVHLAFQHYCDYWYSHLGIHLDPLLATAKTSDAFTLEQATLHAGLLSTWSNSQQVSSLDCSVQSPGKSSNQVRKEQERAFDTRHALDEVESQVGGAGLVGYMNGIQQRTTLSNQTESATAEVNDGDASGVREVSLKSASHDIEVIDHDNAELKFEIELQQKYFPSANKELALSRCLACGDSGHQVHECPALCCTLCAENGKHSNFTCPSKQSCGKCRQRGHQTLNCPEKLFAAGGEANGCDICASTDHAEGACHFIWRSFAPQPEEIRTVCSISVYCYTCGANGHYGPECGLHTRSLLSGGYTWSKSNLQKYLDPMSKVRALSAGVDYSIPKPKEFSIKGKGRANDPFTIEDSDDENDFIRPKIDKPGQRGHIRFAERPRAKNPVLNNAPNGPRIPSSYQADNLSYNVAMDSIAPSKYFPSNGSTPSAPAAGGPGEASGHFQFSGNQRGQGGGEGNDNGSGKKRRKRSRGENQPPGQAPNNPTVPPLTKPKKRSTAKKRERAVRLPR